MFDDSNISVILVLASIHCFFYSIQDLPCLGMINCFLSKPGHSVYYVANIWISFNSSVLSSTLQFHSGREKGLLHYCQIRVEVGFVHSAFIDSQGGRDPLLVDVGVQEPQ